MSIATQNAYAESTALELQVRPCVVPPAVVEAAAPATVAEQLVASLAAVGIDTYFGVPGANIEPLFNALAKYSRTGRVQLVPVRGEAAAGFAADGYYRATGRIAVCTATTGPGTSNLLTAVMSAHADRIPMLVISPQVALAKQGRGAFQDSSIDGYDLPAVFQRCTRYSSTVGHAAQLQYKLARALTMALTPPFGPVHLAIPADVLRSVPPTLFVPNQGARPVACDHAAVSALVEAVRTARSPVFFVGDDAGSHAQRLFELARGVGALVVSSPAGKRWIGHRDPTYRGVLGYSGHSEATKAAAAADVVVTFGATFDELSTNGWASIPPCPIYAVDLHPEHACRRSGTNLVLADVGMVVDSLAAAIPPRGGFLSPVSIVDTEPTAGDAVHPITLMRWLSDALPDDVAVHVDAGNGFSWSTHHLNRRSPDGVHIAMGLSSMCWAIGAAVGAAIGTGRRTVCVTGDGAWLMSSLELTVAVEQRLPITFIILNDRGLGMIRHGQRKAGSESVAVDIAPVRFDRLAEACGAASIRIMQADDLDHIPARWLEDDNAGPCVIDIDIDREAVPPMMSDRVVNISTGK